MILLLAWWGWMFILIFALAILIAIAALTIERSEQGYTLFGKPVPSNYELHKRVAYAEYLNERYEEEISSLRRNLASRTGDKIIDYRSRTLRESEPYDKFDFRL